MCTACIGGDRASRGAAQKIWRIHFRNVSAPLPNFVETFVDNGYYEMYKS
jgi:mannonate dehydratase